MPCRAARPLNAALVKALMVRSTGRAAGDQQFLPTAGPHGQLPEASRMLNGVLRCSISADAEQHRALRRGRAGCRSGRASEVRCVFGREAQTVCRRQLHRPRSMGRRKFGAQGDPGHMRLDHETEVTAAAPIGVAICRVRRGLGLPRRCVLRKMHAEGGVVHCAGRSHGSIRCPQRCQGHCRDTVPAAMKRRRAAAVGQGKWLT